MSTRPVAARPSRKNLDLPGEAEQGVDALTPEADDQITVDRDDRRGEDVPALQEVRRLLVGHHVAHLELHACGPQVVLETLAGPSEGRDVQDDLVRHHAWPVAGVAAAAMRSSVRHILTPSYLRLRPPPARRVSDVIGAAFVTEIHVESRLGLPRLQATHAGAGLGPAIGRWLSRTRSADGPGSGRCSPCLHRAAVE